MHNPNYCIACIACYIWHSGGLTLAVDRQSNRSMEPGIKTGLVAFESNINF